MTNEEYNVSTCNVVVLGINLIDDTYQIDTSLKPFYMSELYYEDREYVFTGGHLSLTHRDNNWDDAERRVIDKVEELANQHWGEGNWVGVEVQEAVVTDDFWHIDDIQSIRPSGKKVA